MILRNSKFIQKEDHFERVITWWVISINARRHCWTSNESLGGRLPIASTAFWACSAASSCVWVIPLLSFTISTACTFTFYIRTRTVVICTERPLRIYLRVVDSSATPIPDSCQWWIWTCVVSISPYLETPSEQIILELSRYPDQTNIQTNHIAKQTRLDLFDIMKVSSRTTPEYITII